MTAMIKALAFAGALMGVGTAGLAQQPQTPPHRGAACNGLVAACRE